MEVNTKKCHLSIKNAQTPQKNWTLLCQVMSSYVIHNIKTVVWTWKIRTHLISPQNRQQLTWRQREAHTSSFTITDFVFRAFSFTYFVGFHVEPHFTRLIGGFLNPADENLSEMNPRVGRWWCKLTLIGVLCMWSSCQFVSGESLSLPSSSSSLLNRWLTTVSGETRGESPN